MGGCKCSYKNCTAKSDGKIHMFHFPVFDKVRCHQWLTNAHKLEFLNLKVSQLKNRVVCQHHFLPHCFMNFKMDRLKFDAVPTENGPFCSSDDSDNKQVIASIFPEEIDVEPLSTKEKAASFKLKFAEFLCNSDIISIEETLPTIKDVCSINTVTHTMNKVTQSPYGVVKLCTEELRKPETQPIPVVPPFSDSTHQILVPKTTENVVDIKFENIQPRTTTRSSNKVKIISEKKITTPLPVQGKLEPVSPSLVLRPKERQNDFIPISHNNNISNKENDKLLHDNYLFYNTQGQTQNAITEQIPFNPQLLEVQTNRCTFVVSPIDKNFGVQLSQPVQLEVEFQPQSVPVLNEELNNTNERKLFLEHKNNFLLQENKEDKNNLIQNTTKSPSQVKSKIPPERVAAIEEKRKFNKKLRDMIEFGLDELDISDKLIENKLQKKILTKVKNMETEEPEKFQKVGERALLHKEKLLKTKEQNQADSVKTVASHLSKEPSLPSTGEYAMAALEERLIKMEETLLRKIDQNSQRILDLKSTIESTSTAPVQTASVIVQTNDDKESYKKQLFNEISQFLGPQLKSMIYEEMFLNKFSKNTSASAALKSVEERDGFVQVDVEHLPPKRRRCRRK